MLQPSLPQRPLQLQVLPQVLLLGFPAPETILSPRLKAWAFLAQLLDQAITHSRQVKVQVAQVALARLVLVAQVAQVVQDVRLVPVAQVAQVALVALARVAQASVRLAQV